MKNKFILGCLFIVTTTACQSGRDREYTYIHEYGVPVGSDQWAMCGRNGQIVTSYQNDVTVCQSFVDGMLHGPTTYTYPRSDRIEWVEEYSNNELKKQVFYNFDGLPSQSIQYGENDVTITRWYPEGNPISIETFKGPTLVSGKYFNSQNQQDSWVHEGNGERLARNEEGHLVSLDTFKEGQLVTSTSYHPNGAPREIACYCNGKLHGERKFFHAGGEPMHTETWENGEQTGVMTIYQYGQKFSEVPFVAGKRNGVEKRFKDNMTLSQEISWKDDKMHGPTITYKDNGTSQSDWYYKGRLTTRGNFESFGQSKN